MIVIPPKYIPPERTVSSSFSRSLLGMSQDNKSFAGARPDSFAQRRKSKAATWQGTIAKKKKDNPQQLVAKPMKMKAEVAEQQNNDNSNNFWQLEGSGKELSFNCFLINSVLPSASAKIIEHPVEDGTVRMDNKVREPRRLTVTGDYKYSPGGFAKDNPEFESILTSYIDDKYKTLTLGGGYGYFEDYFLIRYSSRATNDRQDVFEYTLEIQEVMTAESSADTVEASSNTSTIAKGGNGGK